MSSMRFLDLKRNLKRDSHGLRVVKVALMGDSATQHLGQALCGTAYEVGMKFDLFESDYGQIDREIALDNSDLYRHQPTHVIINQTAQKLRKHFYDLDLERRKSFAEDEITKLRTYYERLSDRLRGAKIIVTNFMELNDGVFGHYANSVEVSFLYQIRRLNYEIMCLAAACPNLFACDVANMSAAFGQNAALDARNYIDADMVFSLDFLPVFAKGIADIVQASLGNIKKCLILDLDNTVWGGVIGDDGIDNIQVGDLGAGKAFVELQYWARELQRRGVLLAVCSKNEEANAKAPFEKHPDMVLALDDIAVFIANWDSKVDNIRKIKEFLNIGYDSIVFLDDNPYERGIVKHHLPDITVPDLPEDPSDYMPYLYGLNVFETVTYTEFDKDRTAHFQQEARREQAQILYTDEGEFLRSLEMSCDVSPLTPFNLPRAAQLLHRSNQFNLRTVRHSEDDLKAFAAHSGYHSLVINAHDKFGDYGIISVIIAKVGDKELFIDSWVMSCRVLKRGIEGFALNLLLETARELGLERVRGEYLPTAKNGLVAHHYRDLGFTADGDQQWVLAVAGSVPREHFIALKSLPVAV